MPALMIRCPTTGKPLPTGMDVPRDFKSRGFVMRDNSTGCPHCGQLHRWNSEDGFFIEAAETDSPQS